MRKQLNLVRQGGRVQRFHGKPLILQENVAEHSFYVAWVVTEYCREERGELPSSKLLVACLQHDLAEAVTGDIPSPTKKALGSEAFDAYEAEILVLHEMEDFVADLDARDTELLKFGDNLAGYMKCLQEIAMGNRFIERSLRNYHAYLTRQMSTVQHLDPDIMRKMMAAAEGETDVSHS